jgi:hypothetical protein
MVDVFYEQEHLDYACRVIQVPFVGVVSFPPAVVTARAWEQSRTNDLLHNRG